MSRNRRFAMVVDTHRCVGCSACVLACMAENDVPDGFCRDWIVQEVAGTFPDLTQEIRSERCMHCSNPPCVEVCPTSASHVGTSDAVLVHQEMCTNYKTYINTYPYNTRYIHPKKYIDKYTFCHHRTERGESPACVAICPTHALTFGDRNDPESEVSQILASRDWRVLHPEAGSEPNVFFLTPDGE